MQAIISQAGILTNRIYGYQRNSAASILAQKVFAFAQKRPGFDPRDYISGWNDKAGRSAYRADSRKATKQLHECTQAFRECVTWEVTDADVLAACDWAWGGRLQIVAGEVDYTVGQYWCTEFRGAAAAVLNRAAEIARNRG